MGARKHTERKRRFVFIVVETAKMKTTTTITTMSSNDGWDKGIVRGE